jgi:hypothetical protein
VKRSHPVDDRVDEEYGEASLSATVCLFANALDYPQGGGLLWEYVNWALGLRSLGCKVIWLEGVKPETSPQDVPRLVKALKERLQIYGLSECLALCSRDGEPLDPSTTHGCIDLDLAVEADLLLNMGYHLPAQVVQRFRRSALVDIDPGLTQLWLSEGSMQVAAHDIYFTFGETVGQPGALVSDAGLEWHQTLPSVALEWWPPCRSVNPDAPFSTISHWRSYDCLKDETGELRSNEKRAGFLPFVDLPQLTSQKLELALFLRPVEDAEDRALLLERGWRVRDSVSVSSTPWDYQRYIQDSQGEFSCAKPSCVKFQNAWVSDRTICYLASGKPAVVQHTGPSRFLPDDAGLFRFRTLEEAARMLDTVAADYDRQSRLARAVAEEYFDARKNLTKLLERALD